MLKFFFMSILCLFFSMQISADIYKWVDEKGQTHFGDSVPNEYIESAKKVEVSSELIGDKTEAEIRFRKAERSLEEAIQERKRREQLQSQRQSKIPDNAETQQQALQRCRDTYPAKAQTAARVACFKSVRGQ